jgi:hypothetical protein
VFEVEPSSDKVKKWLMNIIHAIQTIIRNNTKITEPRFVVSSNCATLDSMYSAVFQVTFYNVIFKNNHDIMKGFVNTLISSNVHDIDLDIYNKWQPVEIAGIKENPAVIPWDVENWKSMGLIRDTDKANTWSLKSICTVFDKSFQNVFYTYPPIVGLIVLPQKEIPDMSVKAPILAPQLSAIDKHVYTSDVSWISNCLQNGEIFGAPDEIKSISKTEIYDCYKDYASSLSLIIISHDILYKRIHSIFHPKTHRKGPRGKQQRFYMFKSIKYCNLTFANYIRYC